MEMKKSNVERQQRTALEVHQWMPTWAGATWGKKDAKTKPPTSFYLCSLPLITLRALSGVNPRTKEARKEKTKDAGYQRDLESERSEKIGRYIQYGYPLSTTPSLQSEDHPELINPGWLPTSIIVNMLGVGEVRERGAKKLAVQPGGEVTIKRPNGQCVIDFPAKVKPNADWLAPLEIIDGQHRLLASDFAAGLPDDYEVPVVLFDRLALEWQAYLFWVINVEPKRINASLAFDLYPELRNQDWLERGEAIKIYQEHRAQELVEILWRHPESPWLDRIELFGKRVEGHVSNAAAIRSLGATFVRRYGKISEDGEPTRIGGLFGSLDREGKTYVLPWKRSQQAAFLISCWKAVKKAVSTSKAKWVKDLKASASGKGDPAFDGGLSLLATDQGFRAVCFSFNAIAQNSALELGLSDWYSKSASEPTVAAVSVCIKELDAKKEVIGFLSAAANALVNELDWRTSSAPGLSDPDRVVQGQYRGSSGYAALNRAALAAITKSPNQRASEAASRALKTLA
jgi:hypothetical protein